ncbi:MAG: hypothetical protein ACI8QZ_001549 [Chlamydiales bacterium]
MFIDPSGEKLDGGQWNQERFASMETGRAQTAGRSTWKNFPLAGAACLASVSLILASCEQGAPDGDEGGEQRAWLVNDPAPPTARMVQVEEFRRDLAATRHPSDGGGSADFVLENGERPVARAGRPGRWTIAYTVGDEGLALGAGVYFMPEPFWGWSAPQDREARAPGYTLISTEAEGVQLEVSTLNAMLLITIGGRAMITGETIRLDYGAGERGAQADLYAERGARLWFSVDGDGDGVRQVVPSSPSIEVLPGPAERVVLHATSVVRPGAKGRVTVALIDAFANLVPTATGTLHVSGAPAGWGIDSIVLSAGDQGHKTLSFDANETGIFRLTATIELAGRASTATSNPIWVDDKAAPVLWADLHGHSNYSDGTGLPQDYFSYARDVAGLDVSALTDHDHFGVRFLDQAPDLWDDIQEQTRQFNDPGRFVTILGFEWTSWIHGHRHVLYFEDHGEVLSSVDPEMETPRQLWDALRGKDALTFAHHSAGDPIPTNWTFAPDPVLEPVTEIMSVHGSSEAADSPARVRGGIDGNFVRDVLDHGYRLGFIGSGDGHDGHPGLPHLSPTYGYRRTRTGEHMGTGGVAGLQAREFTRSGVLESLRARRVFATSGPRIVLDTVLDGHALGASIEAADLPSTASLTVTILGTGPLATLDLVRSGAVATRVDLTGELDVFTMVELDDLSSGEYVYLRATQVNGAMAWSSPFFID